jgi:class 3 adenylate cyclase
MESNYSSFDHVKSDERIREILDSSEGFDEVDDIPSRDRLTYSNGFYVNCTALFIDIRGSSKLTQNHTRPVLGKLYRSYLSECVAVINGESRCREIFINGDCVSGIFSTPLKSDIDVVFLTAAQLYSVTQILNWRLEQKGYTSFRCGVGIAYGRALMLKAGNNGSGINDVIWMGDVVNEASNLCHDGNRGNRKALQVSTTIHSNLNDHNKNLLSAVNKTSILTIDQYEGYVVTTTMDQYLTDLKKKSDESKRLAQGLRGGLLGLYPSTSSPLSTLLGRR